MSSRDPHPSLIEAGRVNPGYLKLDLFCRGLRLGPDFRLGDAQGVIRMRAGLGSGLELRIPGPARVHVNAPVTERFAKSSPYQIDGPGADGRYAITFDGRHVTDVELLRRPKFFDRFTSRGRPMDSVGVIQGTYLGVYFGQLCANWKQPARDACRFCAIGVSVAHGEEDTAKTIQDIVETAKAAEAELGITFVHVNGGFDDRGRYLERFVPLMEALKGHTSLLVGLQIPPLPPADYDTFKRIGVNNISLCFELWDEDWFERVCPGKCDRAPAEVFKAAIRRCAEDLHFDTTNGELIAGLEPIESSMAAVDWLTDVGAIPTICVFRPVHDTPYAALPPPQTEDLVPLFAHAWRRTMEHGLPIGIAPNVHVSIVLTPEEWRWLAPPSERRRYPLTRFKQAAMRAGFRTLFAARRATRGRR